MTLRWTWISSKLVIRKRCNTSFHFSFIHFEFSCNGSSSGSGKWKGENREDWLPRVGHSVYSDYGKAEEPSISRNARRASLHVGIGCLTLLKIAISDRTSLLVAIAEISSLCTWFYDAAQMIHNIDDFKVTSLIYVVRYELRPAWILQYFNEYVVQRTVVTLYVCIAVIPSSTNNHLPREYGLNVKWLIAAQRDVVRVLLGSSNGDMSVVPVSRGFPPPSVGMNSSYSDAGMREWI